MATLSKPIIMKNLLFPFFILICFLSFAQEQDAKIQPLFISNISFNGFDKVYSDLNKVANSITANNFSIKRIDEIRQGQLIISTENIGRTFNNLKIDMRPSLDIEAQRIMFTGNFINPRGQGIIKVK